MKKLLLVILLAACTSAPVEKKESAVIPPEKPVAVIQGNIGFACDTYCTDKEKSRLAKAEKLANEMIQSQCFEKFWMKAELDSAQNKNKSNAELLNQLKTARFTAPVHYYYSLKNVVGYRNPGKPDIYFNRKYHNNFNECNTVSNAIHEWSHAALEWDHDYKATERRPRSGPYTLNAAADKCCFKDKILQ